MRRFLGILTFLALLLPSLPGGDVAVQAARQDDAARAAQAAVTLSEYEAEASPGSAYQLYARLHLDAKVLIPPEAVTGWYESAFFPLAPRPITVTDVTFVDWTWGVTGVTYPDTAEVSYTQEFGNGDQVSEVVRLVRENGEWHWFFGRSQEFINEQIRRHAPAAALLDASAANAAFPADGSAPWGLDELAATGIGADVVLDAMPGSINAHRLDRIESVAAGQGGFSSVAAEVTIATYLAPPEEVIPSGETQVLRLRPGIDATQALGSIVADGGQSPHFVVLRESDVRSGGMVFLLVELYTNNAVGNVPVLFWGDADSDMLVASSMRDLVSLRMLIQEMSAAV